MLSFFRKIRYRLAEDNQFLKYSRYAIGEIVLVVIGILIALQINNWNEYRQERISEMNFLSRIKEDLVVDNAYFKKRINDCNYYMDQNDEFLKRLFERQNTLEDASELLGVFSKYYKSEMVTTQNSTFSEMLNAGELELITDADLKSLLLSYYRRSEEVAKHVAEFNAYTVDVLNIMHDKAPNFMIILGYKVNDPLFSGTNITFEKDYGYLNDPSSDKFNAIFYAASLYGTKHGVFREYFRLR